MRNRTPYPLRRLLVWCMTLLVWSVVAIAQPVEQVEYWRTRYQELLLQEEPRVARAHAIFDRLVQAAGKRSGVVPQLLLIRNDPWGISLPVALPDGWIVLSKGVLDTCYREPTYGDDRLAFVLGHEIAHQLKDDFWHLKFFQALEAAKSRSPQPHPALQEIARFFRAPQEERPAQELRADEHGILYAAMAGFNTRAIMTADANVNFFHHWLHARAPQRIGLGLRDTLQPTPEQRAASLRAHLQQVADKAVVFEVGLWFAYAGDYPKAIRAFEQFLSFFPSREVYHNLATSHHQLALQALHIWQKDTPALPFQLSLTLDPLTRASDIFLRQHATQVRSGGAVAQASDLFRQHLDMAIKFYREALSRDTAYTPTAANLGCALLIRGIQADHGRRRADLFEAVATLQRALEYQPNAPELLNNLGVALVYVEQVSQAQEYLLRARSLAPAYAAPVFNLSYIAQTERRAAEAQRLRQEYDRLMPRRSLRPVAADQAAEHVHGLGIGHFAEDMPAAWGMPAQSLFQLVDMSLTLAMYPTSVRLLSRDGEIVMLMVTEGFRATSARGVAIGAGPQDVLARYGQPTRQLETTQGQSWSYDAQRIAFQLRGGRVVSWLLF